MAPPLPWHLARQRRPVLSKINVAVEIAYAVAERRLQRDEGMSGRERACLERVMATITYGVALHQQLDEAKVKVNCGHVPQGGGCTTLRRNGPQVF